MIVSISLSLGDSVLSNLHFVVLNFQGLKFVNKAFGQYFQDIYVNYSRKLDLVMRLVELYEPYMLFKGMYVLFFFFCIAYFSIWLLVWWFKSLLFTIIWHFQVCSIGVLCSFDDANTEKLWRTARESFIDVESFNFDATCIEWEDYIMHAHIPGLLKHVLIKW